MAILHEYLVECYLYLIEMRFNIFASRAVPNQAALFAYGNMIRYDPTLVDIDIAPITQLRTCAIKIVTFKGGHLHVMWLRMGFLLEQIFALREVAILKRDAVEENHCLIQ